MNQRRQVKRYLRQIKRLIPSDCIGKKDVLQTIRHRIDTYFAEHPDTEMSEFVQEFGTPGELAESFLDEMSGAQLMTDLNRRRRNTVCTGGCLVLIAAMFAAYALYVERTTIVGITETIIIYEDPDEAPTESDFQDSSNAQDKNEEEEEQTK